MPLFSCNCFQRPSFILCCLPLWSSELDFQNLKIATPEPCSRTATRPVCLWQTHRFWSLPSPLGWSVCLVQAIQGFVLSRRIYTRNLAARKWPTRRWSFRLVFVLGSTRPNPTRDLTSHATRVSYDLLTSALHLANVSPSWKKKKRKKRRKKGLPIFFCFSHLFFSGISDG